MNDAAVKYFPQLPVDIQKKDVLHLLGYRRRSISITTDIETKVDKELFIGKGLLRFKGLYAHYDIGVKSNRVILSNGFVVNSEKFAMRVEGCDSVYFFVVTAGVLFTERTGQLIEQGEVSNALLADAVGSAAGEACASAANDYIISLEQDRILTKRYSPGYGDWDVSHNRELLEMLQSEKIGITVNYGGLMQPEKSVSAAIGVKTIFRN